MQTGLIAFGAQTIDAKTIDQQQMPIIIPMPLQVGEIDQMSGGTVQVQQLNLNGLHFGFRCLNLNEKFA